jgi:hypothetical protein
MATTANAKAVIPTGITRRPTKTGRGTMRVIMVTYSPRGQYAGAAFSRTLDPWSAQEAGNKLLTNSRRSVMSHRVYAVWILILSSALPNPAGAVVPTRTVTATARQAPDTSAGVVFDTFFEPALDAFGGVAFYSSLTGTGVVPGTNSAGIWSEGSGSLQLVARLGNDAPGTPAGVLFSTFITVLPTARRATRGSSSVYTAAA